MHIPEPAPLPMNHSDLPRVSRWRQDFSTWSVVVPVATAIYLLTRDAVLSALLPCLCAAVPAARSTFWIARRRQRQPRVQRLTMLGFYTALIAWQIAAAAFVTIMTTAYIDQARGFRPDWAYIVTLLWTLTAAVLATSALGLMACASAFVLRLRIWVHPRAYEIPMLGSDDALVPNGRFNYGIFLVATSISLPFASGLAALLFVIGLPGVAPGLTKDYPWIATVAYLLVVLCVIRGYGVISRRIIGGTPARPLAHGSLPR